jgi:hypothetical protein
MEKYKKYKNYKNYKKNQYLLSTGTRLMMYVETFKSFKVATVNLFNHHGKDMISTLEKELTLHTPDLVVFQEAGTKFTMKGYENIQWCGGDTKYEKMGAALKQNTEWKSVEITRFQTNLCYTLRNVVKIHLKSTKNPAIHIKIGNVHLCGGRYDEKVSHYTTHDNLIKTKKEGLHSLQDCDIVLGDFNSDIHHFLTKNKNPNKKQENFLKDKLWTDEQIKIWNTTPYKFLEEKQFKLVPPEKKTSFFGGTTDVIWYKNNKILLANHGILDMGINNAKRQEDGASDHNGVYATFLFL